MSENIMKISEIGFVPLLVLDDAADAVPLAKALAEGGIPVAEVTFRTKAAAECIRRIAAEAPEVLVGAGTVHTVAQAEEAVAAGAQFIVTPGFSAEVVGWCVDHGVDVVPGTVSPSDIEQAMRFGLTLCKFFPAEAYGGVDVLKALAGPYREIKFLPTGGVSEKNMLDYLALSNVAAVGGSFFCPNDLVREKKWSEISALCQGLIQKMLGFELAHVGINTKDAEDAKQVASRLALLFGKSVKEFPGSYFAGEIAEVIKGEFLGTMGHIGVNTRDIDRAVAYFARVGVELDQDTAVINPAGKLGAIYLKEEIGGFAVHLRRA
ncbi:2-dehydro-3-deoxyphosphogluconate aldolase/4-hydroxy-2-oxoglutarate aldolase [uncultured Eubacteriales bacterium]|uniref:2-dehydro-3-deoxy-phosphogluconate aldolase n=1 Tax=uncultured Eubacteriales bacterium TaxID=172733 RepID=A0A212KGG0_9FIRM|nr:2-dehydro-3-deoxyphosphogluconate aldolase/4-hydroxy-2-oxoglutarate aldolase [uncultured Eubacteriales bacterium]